MGMSRETLQRLQEMMCKTVSHVLTKMLPSAKPCSRQPAALCFSVALGFLTSSCAEISAEEESHPTDRGRWWDHQSSIWCTSQQSDVLGAHCLPSPALGNSTRIPGPAHH